jgi:hypothetical protein
MAWRRWCYRGIEEVAVTSFPLEKKARMEAPALVDSHAEDEHRNLVRRISSSI